MGRFLSGRQWNQLSRKEYRTEGPDMSNQRIIAEGRILEARQSFVACFAALLGPKMIWEDAWKADRGEDCRAEARIVKLYSSGVLAGVIDNAVQIHRSANASMRLAKKFKARQISGVEG
jgi:alkylation response protein AidB-like acyl-CoA dehydrogenase